MLKIIANIPFFVWPLFTILLIGGVKARNTSLVPLKILILIPVAFFTWSCFSFFGKYADNPWAIFFWILSLTAGVSIGFAHIQHLQPKWDKHQKMIEMPGNWIPLILSMFIFTAKFSIGMIRGMPPHPKNPILICLLELFSSVILGIFAGRAVACFLIYKSSKTEVMEHDTQ